MNVNILGSDYEIIISNKNQFPHLEDCDGYFDSSVQKCIIDDCSKYEGKPDSKSNMEKYRDETIRHELIHAFLHESGLTTRSYDEELTEWIAIQFPKMLKAFQEANCL